MKLYAYFVTAIRKQQYNTVDFSGIIYIPMPVANKGGYKAIKQFLYANVNGDKSNKISITGITPLGTVDEKDI